ncbi:hypothetical protein [uncultured Psychrosphaera sp.]|uniref:hypothetical protein n=1 Tax=uncultured Psychrosphaera sp. TaxID=1403522 RepID=UPI0026330BBF|nr:hypothetical protein [uncultured Psychrosphaera sp.]
MNFNRGIFNKIKRRLPLILTMSISLALAGCDSDSDNNTGYMQFYNLSATAPDIYLNVDQEDDDDFDDITYSGVAFTGITGRLEFDTDSYDLEFSWQDEYNSSDLEVILEQELTVKNDIVHFMVMTGDVNSPEITTYSLDVRDDDELDDDSDDELFNIRLLNMYADDSVDLYYSESDETFEEAVLISQAAYKEMSENQKYEQDDVIFYATLANSDDVVFESTDISFSYAGEYIMVIRENTGTGSSPFVLDVVSTSSSTEYSDVNSESEYRVYNGIVENALLSVDTDYTDSLDFYIDESLVFSGLLFGEYSDIINTSSGDFGMTLKTPSGDQIGDNNNYLLSLTENTSSTIFFYLLEEAVDEDNDGDVDENNDGDVDGYEYTINSLVVENSQSESIYSHEVKVINLIDEDEIADNFDYIQVYFVKSDETIENADQSIGAVFATPSSITLLNNTYNVKVIGAQGSSDILMSSQTLTLDEDSKSKYLILEKDDSTVTGYKMTFTNQVD